MSLNKRINTGENQLSLIEVPETNAKIRQYVFAETLNWLNFSGLAIDASILDHLLKTDQWGVFLDGLYELNSETCLPITRNGDTFTAGLYSFKMTTTLNDSTIGFFEGDHLQFGIIKKEVETSHNDWISIEGTNQHQIGEIKKVINVIEYGRRNQHNQLEKGRITYMDGDHRLETEGVYEYTESSILLNGIVTEYICSVDESGEILNQKTERLGQFRQQFSKEFPIWNELSPIFRDNIIDHSPGCDKMSHDPLLNAYQTLFEKCYEIQNLDQSRSLDHAIYPIIQELLIREAFESIPQWISMMKSENYQNECKENYIIARYRATPSTWTIDGVSKFYAELSSIHSSHETVIVTQFCNILFEAKKYEAAIVLSRNLQNDYAEKYLTSILGNTNKGLGEGNEQIMLELQSIAKEKRRKDYQTYSHERLLADSDTFLDLVKEFEIDSVDSDRALKETCDALLMKPGFRELGIKLIAHISEKERADYMNSISKRLTTVYMESNDTDLYHCIMDLNVRFYTLIEEQESMTQREHSASEKQIDSDNEYIYSSEDEGIDDTATTGSDI